MYLLISYNWYSHDDSIPLRLTPHLTVSHHLSYYYLIMLRYSLCLSLVHLSNISLPQYYLSFAIVIMIIIDIDLFNSYFYLIFFSLPDALRLFLSRFIVHATQCPLYTSPLLFLHWFP